MVYKTTNLINNKIYIGVHSTKNEDDGYLGSGRHLRNAINKYGKFNFIREILFRFPTSTEAYNKEVELVNEDFVLRHDTYNIKTGGSIFQKDGNSYFKTRLTINNGKSVKRVLEKDIANYLNEGWSVGNLSSRKIKNINTGQIMQTKYGENIINYLENGWVLVSPMTRKKIKEGRKEIRVKEYKFVYKIITLSKPPYFIVKIQKYISDFPRRKKRITIGTYDTLEDAIARRNHYFKEKFNMSPENIESKMIKWNIKTI